MAFMPSWKMILTPFFWKKYKKKKPSQFNQAATICLNGMETQFISVFLSDCINDAFYRLSSKNHYQVTAGMIHRSILAMRFGCRTLADPNSRKKDRIEFFESLFLKNPIASSKMVTDVVEDPVWSLICVMKSGAIPGTGALPPERLCRICCDGVLGN